MGAVQVPSAFYADHHFEHRAGPALPGDEVAAWLSDWLGQTVLFAVVLFLPQLFPTGPSPDPVDGDRCSGSSGIVLTGTTVGRSADRGKAGLGAVASSTTRSVCCRIGVYNVFNISGAFVLPMWFAALVVRFRRSRGDERLQLKWLVCAAAVMAFFFIGALADRIVLVRRSRTSSWAHRASSASSPCRSSRASRSCATGCTRSTSSSSARCSTAR